VLEQGPVLVISFQAFMIFAVKNSEGKVIEGDAVHTDLSDIRTN
jgi:hypothetical protein